MNNTIEGRAIVKVRPNMGWEGLAGPGDVAARELDGGARLFAAADEEGNGPGALNMLQGETLFTLVIRA